MVTKKLARRALVGPSALCCGEIGAACCCPSGLFGICNFYDATGFLSRLLGVVLAFITIAIYVMVMVVRTLQIEIPMP